MNSVEWAGSSQKSRDDINIERYSRVLRSRFMRLLWTWQWEWCAWSYFYHLKDQCGWLFFDKPGTLWEYFWTKFPEETLRISLKFARTLHHHSLACAEILEKCHWDGKIHPIFRPVKVWKWNFRPYIRRAREGEFINPKDLAESTFLKCVKHLLTYQLRESWFSHSGTANEFDIKRWNITIVRKENIPSLWDMQKALTNKQEKIDRLISILDTASNDGVRVMLFDFGTWIRPDGGHKNSKHYTSITFESHRHATLWK